MQAYLATRQRMLAELPPGINAGRELARATDEAIAQLAAASPARPGGPWALVALGGYGAGALLPASDIDLLVLSDEPERRLKPFVESVLYPLWDSGLKVGHQVRSRKDHLRACREDLTTLTATLTARTIAGDTAFGDAAVASVATAARKRRAQLARELAVRPRPGSPWLLEPDLKDGAGGRRDFDELVWAAAVFSGRRADDPGPLVEVGALTVAELERVRASAAVVAAARWSLQRAGSGNSVLRSDLAADLGIGGEIHEALGNTHSALLATRSRLRGERWDEPTPLTAAHALAAIERGAAALDELELAAHAGALDGLVSGFSALMRLRRPGLTHRHTVGAHSLRAATSVADLCAAADGALARSCAQLSDRPALIVAALTHDVGKRTTVPDHARSGAEPAHEAAGRFGLRPSRAQDVADLVRLHLVLIETALHADIDDEDTVLRTAARIGRRALVAPLHVLSVADSLATGPEAWGPWQQALLSALVARVDAALSPRVDGAGMAAAGDAIRSAALEATTDPDVARFIRAASLRYLATRDTRAVLDSANLVISLSRDTPAAGFRFRVSPSATPDSCEVSVAALDRPELFARVTGALTLAGLDILGADATGTHDRVALDVFTVRSATLAGLTPEVWARFERYLTAALADRLELEVRLAERRRHYAATGATTRTHVDVDPSSGYGTLVRIRAADRVGLLYDVARAISLEGLDIRWVNALTVNGVAKDSFLVVGPDGSAPTDPGELGHLSMRVREALARG